VLFLKRDGVTIRAATISILLHLAGFIVLTLPCVSPTKQSQSRSGPTAKFSRSRITYLMNAARTLPKPKIKEPAEQITRTIQGLSTPYKTAAEFKGSPAPLTVAGEFDGAADLGVSIDPAESPASQNVSGDYIPQTVIPQSRTEFFGSATEKRKICYLVDCSGSMQGLFSRVKKELYKSIDSLEQDQYFAVIFFGKGELIEFEGGKLIRASVKNKQAAYDFIEQVQPAGQGDGIAALNKALNIRDSSGSAPQTIYFLTDGFEMGGDSPQNLEQQIAELATQDSAKTQINPIAFWPQDEDEKMLQTIAEKSSGRLVVIVDENQLEKTNDKK
jgi:uncharacterized protein YegL